MLKLQKTTYNAHEVTQNLIGLVTICVASCHDQLYYVCALHLLSFIIHQSIKNLPFQIWVYKGFQQNVFV